MSQARSFLDRRLWERKYIDLWSVVHLLNGVCFGFAIFFYRLPFVPSFIIFLFFIILWEVIEFLMHVREPIPNQIFDVLTGALGFLTTVLLILPITEDFWIQIIYFTITYIIVWTFAYYGFQSFAIHFNKELEKYKKSFSAAAIIYVAIVVSLFLL